MLKTKPDIKFYDTCSLLLIGEGIFDLEEHFVISSITFNELERIKTAVNKDESIKYSARILTHLLEKYEGYYEVVIHRNSYEDVIKQQGFDINDDMRILSDAIWCNENLHVDSTIFVTNDMSLKNIANIFFGDGMIDSVKQEQDNYTGYKEVIADDSLLASFYQDTTYNHFNLYIGEYLILKNSDGEVVDVRAWTGSDHRYLEQPTINSKWFGKVQPYHSDIYQKLLCDSLASNKITLIKGAAGTGKTYLSLAYLMSQLEKGKIDKIIVFCNTVATANSAKLGYYPGSRDEKLMDSQIGSLLISKFGGREGVQSLMENDKLILLPLSDIRGYDTTNMQAGIYISEAQNLDITLMKLALQRIGRDCICIIDGDIKSQVDLPQFSGMNNGMRRASKVYRGHDIYGEVTLKNIYRSEIARIAESM